MKRATNSVKLKIGRGGISIHALVKRATAVAHTGTVSDVDFNPRPREEGDAVAHTGTVSDVDFNPRPREEGDQVKRLSGASATHFNPRPREEGDHQNAGNNAKI